MSEDLDDIDLFVEETGKFVEPTDTKPHGDLVEKTQDESGRKRVHGRLCQYAEYGSGFMPTTPTIPSLPSGCYSIRVSQEGVYAEPSLPPTGLLLELPEMRSDEVIRVTDSFWDSEKDYKEGNEFVHGGAAFKAGVMIFGPPGTGKSCTIKIVSKKIVARKGTVFFADVNPSYVQTFLTQFATVEKNRKCVVILEDLDSLINNYGEASYLAMLDSSQSIDNVLFIATTNYPERLDPRIYNRPGRFSHVIRIGLPGPKARDAFLRAILKNHRDVDHIVEHSEGFSIDHLSALVNAVYREKKELKAELIRLRKLFKIPKAEEGRPIGLRSSMEET